MMASRAFIDHLLLLASIQTAFSVPMDSFTSVSFTDGIVWVTEVVTSNVDVLETATVIVGVNPSTAQSPSSTSTPTDPSIAIPQLTQIDSTYLLSSSSPITEILTVTATITEPPVTVTISEPPTTVTEIITVPASSSTPSPIETQSTWSAPTQMSDLSAFNISLFAYGQRNLQIVNGIPASASASSSIAVAQETQGIDGTLPIQNQPTWDNSSSVLQLFYPANSINPSSQPQGGADFYATPLHLQDAQTVILEYSIFFPVDFDWALAGKLPGVYGGHKACSGGDDALKCFSTRLMWREGGDGELYLYAPKDKQTASLCSTPPQSVCEADYGLSIGRGSFKFSAGTWTHVRQVVSLNTPGQQDGGFTLQVNGQDVINRSDVFYRDVPTVFSPVQAPPTPDSPTIIPPLAPSSPQPFQETDGLGGLLGGILGGLLFRVVSAPIRSFMVVRDDPADLSSDVSEESSTLFTPPAAYASPTMDKPTTTITISPTTTTVTPQPSMLTTTIYQTMQVPVRVQTLELAHAPKPIGFSGLFFSTFFGGHDPRYASPKDQYVWFKDFSMAMV